MTYSRVDQKVTVEFDITEYATLLAILGAALMLARPGTAAKTDIENFITDLNRTNTDFALYSDIQFNESPNPL